MFLKNFPITTRIEILRCQDLLVSNEVDALMESMDTFNVEELNHFLNYLKSMHCNYLQKLQEIECYLEPLKGDEPLFQLCRSCDLREQKECTHPIFEKESNTLRMFTTPENMAANLQKVIEKGEQALNT